MFNDENPVEQMVLNTLCGGMISNMVAEDPEDYSLMTQINADEHVKIIGAHRRNLRTNLSCGN